MSSNKKKPKVESQLMEKGGRRPSTRGLKKTMHRRLIKESTGAFLDGLAFHNPAAIGVLDLFPVVGAGYTMQNAVVLSLTMLVMTLPACVLNGQMKIPVWIRPVAALVLSGTMYLSVTALTKRLMPQAFSALSIYAVLMIDDSIILSRVNDYTPSHITLVVLMDSLGRTAGLSAMILSVAALREIRNSIVKDTGEVYHAGAYPLVGLLLPGVIAALTQHTNAKRAVVKRKAKQEWKWQYSYFFM